DNLDLQEIEEANETLEEDILRSLTDKEREKILYLINLTWQITRATLEHLATLQENEPLDLILQEFLQRLSEQADLVASAFSDDWVNSAHESWSFLRLQSPTACALLNRLREPRWRDQALGTMRWPSMLATLLRVAGDLIRLKLLVGTCIHIGRSH